MIAVRARLRRRRLTPPATAVLAASAMLLAACGGGDGRAEPADPAPVTVDDAQRARSLVAEEVAARRAQQMDGAVLEIPRIGVSTPLVSLGLNDDGTMEVPSDFARAGWYHHSPTPGETGPSVIAGHVDSRSGPAVFFRLADLRAGDEVHVRRADGVSVTFVVERVEQHPKDAFPHDEVYGDTAEPELRLITCGGVFDAAARAHRDNIIVYASMTAA